MELELPTVAPSALDGGVSQYNNNATTTTTSTSSSSPSSPYQQQQQQGNIMMDSHTQQCFYDIHTEANTPNFPFYNNSSNDTITDPTTATATTTTAAAAAATTANGKPTRASKRTKTSTTTRKRNAPAPPSSKRKTTPSNNSDTKPKKEKKPKTAAPATIPHVFKNEEGVEHIQFNYSAKGQIQSYIIRTGDIDTTDLDTLPHDFKLANCVYPRAFCNKQDYTGNRWDYETTVNNLGWKLCWSNPDELCGKRGLIQRAVDSYRNRFPEMRSRRVARQEKLVKGTLRKRNEKQNDYEKLNSIPSTAENIKSRIINPHSPNQRGFTVVGDPITVVPIKKIKTSSSSSTTPASSRTRDTSSTSRPTYFHASYQPQMMTFETIRMSAPVRYQIRVDIDTTKVSDMPHEFKLLNSVFPRVYTVPLEKYTLGPPTRWEHEAFMNELGWKLAWLNPGMLSGKRCLLQRALDTFVKNSRTADRFHNTTSTIRPRPGKRLAFGNHHHIITTDDDHQDADATHHYYDNTSSSSSSSSNKNEILGELQPEEAFALEAAVNGLLAVADAATLENTGAAGNPTTTTTANLSMGTPAGRRNDLNSSITPLSPLPQYNQQRNSDITGSSTSHHNTTSNCTTPLPSFYQHNHHHGTTPTRRNNLAFDVPQQKTQQQQPFTSYNGGNPIDATPDRNSIADSLMMLSPRSSTTNNNNDQNNVNKLTASPGTPFRHSIIIPPSSGLTSTPTNQSKLFGSGSFLDNDGNYITTRHEDYEDYDNDNDDDDCKDTSNCENDMIGNGSTSNSTKKDNNHSFRVVENSCYYSYSNNGCIEKVQDDDDDDDGNDGNNFCDGLKKENLKQGQEDKKEAASALVSFISSPKKI